MKPKNLNQTTQSYKPLLTFKINEKEYALDILNIQQIIRLENLKHQSDLSLNVKGLVNLSGFDVPIIDLREKLGLKAKKYSAKTMAVILKIPGQKVGLAIENSDVKVIQAPEALITLTSKADVSNYNQLFFGNLRLGERLISLLNADSLVQNHILQEKNKNDNAAA